MCRVPSNGNGTRYELTSSFRNTDDEYAAGLEVWTAVSLHRRPTERSTPSGNNNGRSEQRSDSPRNFRQSDGGPRSMNVPRPTGPVRQASNQSYDYRGSQSNRGYSSPDRGSYNQSPRSSGSSDRGGYSQSPRSYGNNDRGSYNQSARSSGSYDRGSYSQSPRSYGSYGSGQRSYPSSGRSNAPSMSGNSGSYSQGSSPVAAVHRHTAADILRPIRMVAAAARARTQPVISNLRQNAALRRAFLFWSHFLSYSGLSSFGRLVLFFFTFTTVILVKPSSKVGAFSLSAIRRRIASSTLRSRF